VIHYDGDDSNYVYVRSDSFTSSNESIYDRAGTPGDPNDASNWTEFDANGCLLYEIYTGDGC
jgi:hypothetical protein